jgi:hypothetical protein
MTVPAGPATTLRPVLPSLLSGRQEGQHPANGRAHSMHNLEVSIFSSALRAAHQCPPRVRALTALPIMDRAVR